jgi:hypothetical protein
MNTAGFLRTLVHSATFRGRRQQFTLGYDSGTAAFTAGKTLTGATSHATAIIVSTGSIASGTLTLHTISGTFLNDETITDNGTIPGAALVNGTIAEKFDSNGELVYSDVDTSVSCKFYRKAILVQLAGQVSYTESKTRLMLPSTVTPAKGDQMISTVTGFAGTWMIDSANPLPAGISGSIHHWECDLAKEGI